MEDQSGADYRARVERAESSVVVIIPEAKRGKPWSDAEMRDLRKHYAAGKRLDEISEHINRSPAAIERKIRTMKLNRPTDTPMLKPQAYALAGKTQAQTIDDAKRACVDHLIDLRRAFGLGPNQEHWIGVARYRARCEWHNPPSETTRYLPQSWFQGSAFGSPSQSCVDG